MRLLILTQKVDRTDPILGFFHRWIEEFAKHCESVIVICLEKGEHSLSDNVRVLSLGKDESASKMKYLRRFYQIIWSEKSNYDSVFVHMNPEYAVLGGMLWRLWNKNLGLWYVHKAVNPRIWLAEKLAHSVFTSAPESFRLKSTKVHYVGHGIDTNLFRFSPADFSKPTALYVGRIARIKDIYAIIRGAKNWPLTIVGEPITEDDRKYKRELEELIANEGVRVNWYGAVLNYELPRVYYAHSISINASPDGGMDKTVLESLACGRPAFVKNLAFKEVFSEHFDAFSFKNEPELSEKLRAFMGNSERSEIAELLSKRVHSEYSVTAVIEKIMRDLHV